MWFQWELWYLLNSICMLFCGTWGILCPTVSVYKGCWSAIDSPLLPSNLISKVIKNLVHCTTNIIKIFIYISYVRLFVVFTYYFSYYEILATTHHKTTMEASCSCNCTCSGTWVTPMVSVPVHDISFGGDNAMHCSQSSLPRHQLGCNLPSLNRSPRSTDNYNDPNDSNQVILIISAFVIYTVVVILCTLMVSKRLKRCVRNNNQDVWPFLAWFGWVDVLLDDVEKTWSNAQLSQTSNRRELQYWFYTCETLKQVKIGCTGQRNKQYWW